MSEEIAVPAVITFKQDEFLRILKALVPADYMSLLDAWDQEAFIDMVTIPQFQRHMVENSERWFPNVDPRDITILILGLCGEAGECADILKKVQRGSITLQEAYEPLCEELVDTMHYLFLALYALRCDPGPVYIAKTEINEQRFGNAVPTEAETPQGVETTEHRMDTPGIGGVPT